jgi:hypothetical protein
MQETKNLIGTPKQRRKKYSQIVKEMGARGITLEDISKDDLNGKYVGFLDMMNETGMTMDEAVVIQQYSKAIIDRDTKSAEFLRDTVGERPSTQIDMRKETSGLAEMDLEELLELRDLLKAAKKD